MREKILGEVLSSFSIDSESLSSDVSMLISNPFSSFLVSEMSKNIDNLSKDMNNIKSPIKDLDQHHQW